MSLLIPSKKISIQTCLSVEKAMSFVSDIAYIESLSLFQSYIWYLPFGGKLFEGRVSAEGFRIYGRRTAHGSPWIELDGKFVHTTDELQVYIHLKPRLLVTMITMLCFCGTVFISLALIYNWIIQTIFYDEGPYIALSMFAVFYTLNYLGTLYMENLYANYMRLLFTEKLKK